MKKYWNYRLIKILVSILLFILSYFIKIDLYKTVLLLTTYIIISYEIYIEAIKEKNLFDENFLMIVATLGAIFIKNYHEAILVILLFQIGEYLEDLAIDKTKKSITDLMNLKIENITLEKKGKVRLEEAKIGDIFLVKPGEKVPLDGIIIEGESYMDTSSITGEVVPKLTRKDDLVLSGYINQNSLLKIKATSTSKTSTAQRILDCIENSNDKKTNTETFITKFSKIYTPTICLLAILIVLIPTIIGKDFNTYLYRSLIFLVTACPCALVISVPLGYFCGIGKSSKKGILVKGSKELEKLSNIDYIFFDKTGTLTEGVFEINKIKTNMEEEYFLQIIASSEENSVHPIATVIKEKNKKELLKVSHYEELPGKGVKCKIGKDNILVGNETLLKENNIIFQPSKDIGTIVYASKNNEFIGYIVISDKLKNNNFSEIKKQVNKEIIILSGDNKKQVEEIAKELEIKTFYNNLLPVDKVKKVESYKKNGTTVFVGDGINDAPVLKIADVGISMGNLGSEAAIEASDVVLMNDNLNSINKVIDIAKTTKRKVKYSIIFSLLVKFIVLFLGMLGKSTMLLAVFADVGVTLLVIIYVLTIYIEN